MDVSIKNQVNEGDDYFLSSDIIALGSKIYKDSSSAKYTVISKEINTEGGSHKYFIDSFFDSSYESDAVFLLIEPQSYFLPSDDGDILKFNGESPFNFSLQSDQPSTISFSSEDLADGFTILGEHGHLITKEGTSIHIIPQTGGANKFYFKIKDNTGSISIANSCTNCDLVNFEDFISPEKINSTNQLTSFLSGCGTSFSTKSFIRAEAFELPNGSYHYFAAYCCDTSSDILKNFCYIEWTINQVQCDTEINHSLSPPKLICSEDNLNTDTWIKISESELVFYRRSHFCSGSCHPEDITPRLLVEPTPPSNDLLLKVCLGATPTTQAPKEHTLDYSSQFIERNVVHTEPLYGTSSSLVALSEVTESYNEEDLTDRSFYQESDNGYFFEKTMPFLKSDTGTEIDGDKLSTSEDDQLSYSNEHYSSFAYDDFYFIKDSLNLESDRVFKYHSIVSGGDLPVYVEPEGLIKDNSLFDKVFIHTSLTNPREIIDKAIASINLPYWFSTLPQAIYKSNSWWNNLGAEFLPKFSLDLDYTDLGLNHSVFYNGAGEFEFSSTLNYTDQNSYSLITLDSLSSLFSSLDFNSDLSSVENFKEVEPIDFQFFFSPGNDSRYIEIPLVFEMSIDLSKVDDENKELLNASKIIKKENLKILIDLPFLENYNFSSNFGVDKSFGITNPKFALTSGNFYNLNQPFSDQS